MKIAIVADLHLNKSVYKGVPDREWSQLPFRNGDFMRAFRFICDEVIKEKPKMLIINGDIYDHFEPTNEVRGFFSAQLKRLVEVNIAVIILIGNHDVCRKHHALKDIQELGLKNIKVIDSPTILNLKESDLNLLFFPYSINIERGTVTIKEEFDLFLKRVEKESQGNDSLFFGHFGVQNAIINQYTEEDSFISLHPTATASKALKTAKAFRNHNKDDIGMADLDNIGAKYVFLGDFHQFQIMDTQKCISMYTGSIEKNSFSEASQKKGFVIYDDSGETIEKDSNLGCCRFVEYPNCRPMIELKGNLDDIKKQFHELNLAEYQDGIFKLSFVGEREELIAFSTGLDAFKKEIVEKTNAIHIFHRQHLNNSQMQEQASQVEKEIDEKGHIEVADVIDVVKEIINEKISDKKECARTTELAIEIYKTSMEKE